MKRKTEASIRLGIGIMAIAIACLFFIVGDLYLKISTIFREVARESEVFTPNNKVDFEDIFVSIDTIDDFRITKTDDDPLEVGKSLGFHAYVGIKEMPKEIILHLFHEDFNDFFVGDQKSDYRSLSNELKRIPTLKYGDIYNIKSLSPTSNETNEHYDLNAVQSITFNTPGTYFVQISIKTQNDTIEHYKSPKPVLVISDPTDDHIRNSIDKLVKASDEQKADSLFGNGWAFIAVGIGLVFSGTQFIMDSLVITRRTTLI